MPSHSTPPPAPRCRLARRACRPVELALRRRCAGCADQAGRLRPHRYYSSLISTPYYSGRPPGHGHRRCACAGGSRLTPGGGQVMPRTRGLLGVLGAAPPAICRRESVPRRVWEPPQAPLRPRASPQAPPTPVEELPRARQVIRVPRRPRNGQGTATRCLWLAQMAGPGRPEGWLQSVLRPISSFLFFDVEVLSFFLRAF